MRIPTSHEPSLAASIIDQIERVVREAEETSRPLEVDPFRGRLFELFVMAEAADLVKEQSESENSTKPDLTADGLCRTLGAPLESGRRAALVVRSSDQATGQGSRPHAAVVVRDADVDGMVLRLAALARIPPGNASPVRFGRRVKAIRTGRPPRGFRLDNAAPARLESKLWRATADLSGVAAFVHHSERQAGDGDVSHRAKSLRGHGRRLDRAGIGHVFRLLGIRSRRGAICGPFCLVALCRRSGYAARGCTDRVPASGGLIAHARPFGGLIAQARRLAGDRFLSSGSVIGSPGCARRPTRASWSYPA